MAAEPQVLPAVGSAPLYRLVYMSQCRLPADDGTYADTIDTLLRWSRDWNGSHEITGALLFSSGYFAQVLEGPPLELKGLIGNIICDSRHRGLRLLECGPAPERLFGNWSMAYTDGTEQFDLLAVDVLGSPKTSHGAAILGMLRDLVMPERVF